jgi:hypothetical protein
MVGRMATHLETLGVYCPECNVEAGEYCVPDHRRYPYCPPHTSVWTHKARHIIHRKYTQDQSPDYFRLEGTLSDPAIVQTPEWQADAKAVRLILMKYVEKMTLSPLLFSFGKKAS